MLNIERVLKQTRLCLALTGLRPEEFLNLLPAFAEALKRRKKRDYDNNPERERKLGGGRKGFVPSAADKLIFIPTVNVRPKLNDLEAGDKKSEALWALWANNGDIVKTAEIINRSNQEIRRLIKKF